MVTAFALHLVHVGSVLAHETRIERPAESDVVGNAECQVAAVDDFVTLFDAIGVGRRGGLFVVETQAVFKADCRGDKCERCPEE